jgi:CP family cyanate transporter-like MFS transporter
MLSAVAVLVVATNLRPAITAVGPVLELIGQDTGLDAGSLGLLGAVPLLAFAVVSPLVHLLTRRIGAERAVFYALLVLIFGTVLRSLPGWSGNLWLGTAILGASVAVCNVIVPAIVKRDFPHHVPLLTGAYSAVLTGFAALASGVSHPIAVRAGWPLALGIWAGLSVIAALCWIPRLRHAARVAAGRRASRGESTRRTMWTSATAWQVTLFMGFQSTTFFLLITWLPTIEASYGIDPATAGWHLFLLQVAGMIGGIGVTGFMRGRTDQRAVAVAISVLMMLAMIGILTVPSLVVIWAIAAGLSTGSALVVALTLVAQRARTPRDAGRLSGMVQGVGYLIAAGGPAGAGLLFEATGSWTAPIVMIIVIAAAQLIIGMYAGRDRFTHPED